MIICPDITKPEWQYAEETLGGYNAALVLYDMLGMREPSKAEVDAVARHGYDEISSLNTKRVWDIQNVIENGIVETTEDGNVQWRTETDGKRHPVLKGYYERHAKSRAKELSEKYKDEPVTIQASEYSFKTKEGYNRYPIIVKDNTYNTYWDSVNFIGPIREMEQDIVRQEREEMDRTAESTPFVQEQEQRESIPFPNSITQETYYHASQNPNIDNFSLQFEGQAHMGKGLNFAKSYEDAKFFGPYVYEVKLNISKWVTTDEQAKKSDTYGIDDVDEVVVHNENQVKITKFPNERTKSLPDILSPVEREQFDKQKEVLRKTFPQITAIHEDPQLEVVGVLHRGGNAITVNPLKMTQDTLGHEFGHLLIDLTGGMANSFIKLGRDQLRGTEIEKRVYEKYSDLVEEQDERIDKEILATAVGMEVAKIFVEEERQNKFARWLLRFFRKVKNVLGIEKSVARQLAERMVKGEPIKTKLDASTADLAQGLYLQDAPAEYEQFQKDMKEGISNMDELIDKINDQIKKAKRNVARKLAIYGNRPTGQVTIDELKDLEKVMSKASPMKGMVQFTRFALDNTRKVYERYLALRNKELKGKEVEYTPKMLDEWRTYVSAYDMLEEFRDVLRLAKDNIKLFGTENDNTALDQLFQENRGLLETAYRNWYGDENTVKTVLQEKNIIELLLPLVNEAISLKNTIKRIYVDKGYEFLSDFLSNTLRTEIEGKYRESADIAYNKLDKAERDKISRDEYIEDYLNERSDIIREEARKHIEIELKKAQHGDISYLNRWVDTVLNSPDALSSAIGKIYARQIFKANKEAMEAKYEFVERVRNLEKALGRNISTADEDFFNFMLEYIEGIGYSQYLVSPVPSKLILDYKDKVESIRNDKTSTGKPLNKQQVSRGLFKWREEAAPRNKEAYFNAQRDFLIELKEQGLVTTKQIQAWEKNEDKKGRKKKLKEIFEGSEEGYTEFVNWLDRNIWNYRDLSPYYAKFQGKWNKLQEMREKGLKNGVQTDERVKFYDFIVEMQQKADSKLPFKYRLGYKLPSVLKETMDRIRSGQGVVRTLKREVGIGLTKQKTDVERGQQFDSEEAALLRTEPEKESEPDAEERTELVNEADEPVHFIPVYYTNEIDQQDQDFDVASIYFNFYKMATDYQHKSEFLPEVEMIKYFIENRDVVKTDSKGRIIKDAMTKVNPNLEESELTIKGHNSKIAAQIDDFMKTTFYGMRKEEEPDLHILGMKIDRAKGLDAINKYTGVNLLGVNFIQGFANVTLGEILQTIDSVAGQYYDRKDLTKATKVYYQNLGGILGDVGQRAPMNLVSRLNDLFDTLNEYEGGKINRNSRFRELIRTDTLFFTAHAGEHYMQTRLMLAMLNRLKAKDSDGKVIGTMLDMVKQDEKGNIFWDERVDNFGIIEQADFKNRMKRVAAFLHGEYSKEGMSAIQRTALGRMAMMFRKFMIPGFKRRFDKKQWNELLMENTEGAYRTFGRYAFRPVRAGIYNFFKLFGKDLVKFKQDLGSTKWSDLTRLEKANIIRTLGEATFLMSAIIMGNFFVKMRDADDDHDQFWSFMAYQAFRLRAELAFYVNPMETMKILRSPAASMSTVESVLKLFGQMMDPLMTGTFELERYQRGPWEDHYKIEKTITQMVPAYKQIYRLRDIDDQLSWFNR